MKNQNYFNMGFKDMLPITTGIIPFGAVVGSIYSEAQMTSLQSIGMNVFVFAGASQLAAVELMTKHAATIVVIITGLIINLRFLLYSAAISPVVQNSRFLTKLVVAYLLTDQSYAVMSANESKLHTNEVTVQYYLGTAICMTMVWHAAVAAGFIFGNFAPSTWSLDYAVPLSFVALVIPTLKNRNYIYVGIFSSVVSVLLYSLPFRIGLIITSGLGIALAAFLSRKQDSR